MRFLRPNQDGFTLIEILVAVLVLSLGVLGLVGLESLSLKNNLGAYYRSQATILSYELADKIRANQTVDYSTASISAANHSCISYGSAGANCGVGEIAENDRFVWETKLQETLPFGSGSVVKAGDIYTISVNWDSDRDGAQDQVFSFSFESL